MVRGHEKARRKATPAGKCDPLESRRMLSGNRLVELVSPGDPNFPAAEPIGDPADVDSTVSYDLATGATVVTAAGEAASAPAAKRSVDAVPGRRPTPGPQDVSQDDVGVHGGDDRVEVADPRFSPESYAVKLEMTFPNGAQYIGSGIMQSSFHVLTAGHCIYSAADGGWATSVRASPAQDDVDASGGDFGRWYGTANATNFRSYTGWTGSATPDWDWGLITLDRSVGDSSGWAGAQWTGNDGDFNGMPIETRGYPGELQFGTHQYHVNGPSTNATALRINYLMDTTGGQSGSGIIRDDGNGRTVGVVAYAGTATNFGPRMTENRFNDLYDSWIPGDAAPTDRADLVAWDEWFNTDIDYFTGTTVSAGDAFTAGGYVRNNGTAAAAAYTVDFYASTNDIISTGDYYLGTASMGSLGSFSWAQASATLTVPSMPEGDYHVGYLIDAGDTNAEFLEGNNSRAIDGGLLTVVAVDPDDTIAEAAAGGPRAYDGAVAGFIDASDVDIYEFTAAAGERLAFDIDTDGTGIDSYLRLFDAAGNQLDARDDGFDPEPPGTYIYDTYFEHTFAAAGVYYIGVSDLALTGYDPLTGGRGGGTSTRTGPYELTIHDLDDEASEAATLVIDEPASAGVGSSGDVDMYAFSVPAAGWYGFDVDTDGFDSALRLFDAAGAELAENDIGYGPFEDFNVESFINYEFPAAGTYYLGVSSYSNISYDANTGDGDVGGSGTGAYTLEAFASSAAPAIDRLSTNARFVENRGPVGFSRSARILDDTLDYEGAVLRMQASYAAGGPAGDHRLGVIEGNGIKSGTAVFGSGSGQITIAKPGLGDVPVADVEYLGDALEMTFLPGVTRQEANAVLRAAGYDNVSDSPENAGPDDVFISVSMFDPTGIFSGFSTAEVDIVDVADNPVMTGVLENAVFTEDGGPVPLTGAVTVTDADTTDWGGARLDVVVRTPRDVDDLFVLDVAADAGVSVDSVAPGGTVSVDGFPVGTLQRGTEASRMIIDFLPGSTAAQLGRVMQLVRFDHLGDAPRGPKTFRFTLTDPAGGRGVVQEAMTVNTANDAPTILNVDGRTVSVVSGTGPRILASSFAIDDPDFGGGGGVLALDIPSAIPGDELTIVPGAGVSVSGTTVFVSGIDVGTVAGLGTSSMTVTFNANATAGRVRSVGRRVAYEAQPGTASGNFDINFDFQDELGAAAPTATLSIILSDPFSFGGGRTAGLRAGGGSAMDALFAGDDEDWWASLN